MDFHEVRPGYGGTTVVGLGFASPDIGKLARASARVPGCFVLDVSLPDLNGLELQKRRSRHIASNCGEQLPGPEKAR